MQSDGGGGTWADHVEFVPLAMPSILSSEMSTGYGSGAYTGVYKGVSGTYDRATVQPAEWDAHATTGGTSADKQQSNRNDLEAAWHTAIRRAGGEPDRRPVGHRLRRPARAISTRLPSGSQPPRYHSGATGSGR